MNNYKSAWIAGILIACFFPIPDILWLFFTLYSLLSLSIVFLQKRIYQNMAKLILVFTSAVVFLFLFVHFKLGPVIPAKFIGHSILVVAQIISLVNHHHHHYQFIARLLAINHQKIPFTWHVRLSDYGYTPIKLHLGQYWQWQIKLKRALSNAYPGGFDYRAWLAARGMRATGYIQHTKVTTLLANHPGLHLLSLWRGDLRGYLQHQLGHLSQLPTILALLLGDRSQFTERQWQILQDTGTNHLFVISGLHIGLMSTLSYQVTQWLWRKNSRCCQYYPAALAASWAAIVSAFCYSGLAGFALTTQRALVMVCVLFGAKLLRCTLSLWQGWLNALFIVLLFDPLAPLTMSFWLSFAAVFMLLWTVSEGKAKHWLRHWGQTQWICSIGLLPWSLWWFQQIPLLGSLANFIAVPLIAWCILPLGFVALFLESLYAKLGTGLFFLLNKLLTYCWQGLAFLAQLPYAYLHFSLANIYLFACLLLAVLMYLLPRYFPLKHLLWLWLLPVLSQSLPPVSGKILTDRKHGTSHVEQTHFQYSKLKKQFLW